MEGCSNSPRSNFFFISPVRVLTRGACLLTYLISRYVSMLPVAILVHMKWYALSLSASSMLLHPLLHVAITV